MKTRTTATTILKQKWLNNMSYTYKVLLLYTSYLQSKFDEDRHESVRIWLVNTFGCNLGTARQTNRWNAHRSSRKRRSCYSDNDLQLWYFCQVCQLFDIPCSSDISSVPCSNTNVPFVYKLCRLLSTICK